MAEIALTLVLAVTAGLLLRSLYELSHSSPGFDPDHILTIRISPNQLTCAQRSACIALYDRVIDQAKRIGDVGAVAISNSVPLDGELPNLPIDVEGHPKTVDHPAPMVWFGAVSEGLDVVDRLEGADTDAGDRPRAPLTIESLQTAD